MKKFIFIIFALLLSAYTLNAQTWEFVGLDSMVIRQLFVFGDTIYAGTKVRNGINISAGLYYSSDGGSNWTQLDSVLGDKSIIDLEFLPESKDTFYLVKRESPYSNAGKLYKTTNGGNTWQIITALESKFISWIGISNINYNELYALQIVQFPTGSTESLYRSTDSGVTWEEIGSFPSDSHGNRVTIALDLLRDSTLYAGVGTSLIGDYFYKSTDKGDSWFFVSTPPVVPSEICTDYFIPERVYLIGKPYVSNSGGLNWFASDSGFNMNEYYLSFYQDRLTSKLLFELRTDGLYSSSNVDFYWRKIEGSENLPLAFGIGGFRPSDNGLLKNIIIDDNSNTLYVGTGYGIYKRDYITDVNYQASEGLNDFRLEQNYPNPFNPGTVISYRLPVSGFVDLKVYDQLGIEVATLVSKEQSAGSYEVVFDGTKLSSGIYIYKLTSGAGSLIRKMIYLK